MTRYLVGIDLGSQSAKVSIFDEDGNRAAVGRHPLRAPDLSVAGRVEHPDDDLWTSLTAASQEAIAEFSRTVPDGTIAGVGLCGIRFCRAVLSPDGSLAQPVISWMDDRVGRPHEASMAEAGWVTSSSGYLTHRLTGAFVDSAAAYRGMWPIEPATGRWLPDGAQFASFGIARSQLFDLVQPGDVLGTVTADAAMATGLPVGLPVIATANDKAVEALGCGLLEPGRALISLGTYIAAMTPGQDYREGEALWSNVASTPGVFLYESHGVRRGMWTVSWLRDLLGSSESELESEAIAVGPGADGLLTVPDWLAPDGAAYRRGMMLGFDGRHGRGHLYRSALEGIVITMRRHLMAAMNELDESLDEVVISGGGAQSDLMAQTFADALDCPVIRPMQADAAGVGAAICAAVATGVHADFGPAVDAMVRVGDRFEPDDREGGSVAAYRALAEVYDEIHTYTDPLLRRIAALSDDS